LAGIGEGTVQIRDSASGAPVGSLFGESLPGRSAVYQIAFTQDGSRILTGSPQSIHIWDPVNYSGMTQMDAPPGKNEFTYGLAVTPDHQLIATGGQYLTWWDTRTKTSSADPVADGEIQSLAFSPDSRLLAAGLLDGAIRVYDVATRTPAFTLLGHHGRVTKVLFSPDGATIVSSSADRTVRTWRRDTHAMVTLIEFNDPVNSIALSPDGRRLVTGSGDLSALRPNRWPTVRVWDPATGRILLDIDTRVAGKEIPSPFAKVEAAVRGVSSVTFSPDGGRILTVENIGVNVRTWDSFSGSLLRTFKAAGPAAFLPGGNRIVAGARGHLAILDTESTDLVLSLRHDLFPFTEFAISADGAVLVEKPARGPIRLWDATASDETEAWSTVELLYSRLGFSNEVMESIRSDRRTSAGFKNTALRVAQAVKDGFPEAHRRASWSIAKSPGQSAVAYRRALEHAKAACVLAPWSPRVFAALGAAQYRVGLYEEAVLSLRQSNRMSGSFNIPDLAFMAMAQWRLGQRQEGLSTLHELRSAIGKREADRAIVEGNADELDAFVREAESVVTRFVKQ
jgi:WD40 repeat protein